MESAAPPAASTMNPRGAQKFGNITTQRRPGLRSSSKPLHEGSDSMDTSSTKKRKLVLEPHNNSKTQHTPLLKEEKRMPVGGGTNLDVISASPQKRSRRKTGDSDDAVEKRLRPFRKHAPKTFLDRLERVRSQRMFLLDRNRRMNAERSHEEELFDIAGTTGNIYQVTISTRPSCTCPDNAKGNQCKHIIYVMVNVLKAPEHLSYQLAFLTSELATIFAAAPATPQSSISQAGASTNHPGKRKAIEGDCPVCVMEFEAGDDIIWCRAACGNNIHRQCFETWARSKPGQARCVYCRTPWAYDASDAGGVSRVCRVGAKNAEGYVNVAAQLGLSGRRDTSSYHQHWVRRQYGSGEYGPDDAYGNL